MTKPKDAPAALSLILKGPIIGLAPADGRRVRKPDGSVLAEAGERVNVDDNWTYWARRAEDGDVIAVDLPSDGDDA